jgi:hypothetical protein
VKIRGTPQKGTIVQIHHDINDVKWDGNKPLFVRVQIGDDVFMGHPNQLKRINK